MRTHHWCLTLLAMLVLSHVETGLAVGYDDPVEINSRTHGRYADLWANQARAGANSSSAAARSRTKKAPQLVHTYVQACVGNWPTRSGNDGLCQLSIQMCRDTPKEGDAGYWEFTASPEADPEDRMSWLPSEGFRCLGGTPAEAAVVEPVFTVEDFRRLPLPAAVIRVQPPDRNTLVNIPTNLYTDASAVILRTTVLGIPVRVRATPFSFRWRYGDGTTLATSDPGDPYPELRTAHTYDYPGEVRVGLSTVYTGEYSVAGGPWRPVEGTATVPSRATTLTVTELRNHLVTDTLE